MQTAQLEKLFFRIILSDPDYLSFTKDRFFENKVIGKLFKICKIWWEKYKEIPSKDQIWEVVKHKGLETEIPESQIEIIWEVDLSKYDAAWIKEYTEYFIQWKNLEASSMDFIAFLKSTQVTPENISEIVEKAKSIILDNNNIDFKFSEGSDFFDPASHIQHSYNTFSSGYPHLDTVSGGGFRHKTLTVFVGQAKVGKSLWMGNLAAQAIKMGNNVVVLSMEMDEALYTARIGSNILSVPIKEYKEISKNSDLMKTKINDFRYSNFGIGGAAEPGRLHIKEFPTSTASTIDVENYLRKIEEKFKIKFKIVIIDYINIMKNWRNANSENTYMKIKQIAEDLRGIASRNNWAIISATQTKQSAFDATDMAMNAVAESSGLVATVDLMFGIIQDTRMYAEKQYKLKVLANRNEGFKNAFMKYSVDYNYMRLTEYGDITDDGI
jgi:archaellum biogenesis ATPase FlaH